MPQEAVKERAAHVLRTLGSAKVQSVMQSSSAWRELKSAANQQSPVLQLPSELDLARLASSKDGKPILSKRQKRQQHPLAKPFAKGGAESVVAPTPDHIVICKEVFVCKEGPLEQIRQQDIGPQATGVVVLPHEIAAPYAKVARPVSAKALGLLVLGSKGIEDSTVQAQSLQFMAQIASTSEPLLLAATLYQIGDGWVAKYQPEVRVRVDLDPSCVVRIIAYRDEYPAEWTVLTKAPVRAVVEQVSLLRTCKVAGCSCEAWHGRRRQESPRPCWRSGEEHLSKRT